MKKLYMITGFLGAGKTTFLKNIIHTFDRERITIIVNEFGAEGVDGKVLREQGIESYEITNGSIFCVCRKDMFMDALKMAHETDSDTIIVETSGLSDPLTSDEILNYMQKVYHIHFDFRGIVSMIDAKNFFKVLHTAVVVENQIKSADLFVINKCDLGGDIAEIKKALILRNEDAKIIETTFGEISYDIFHAMKHTIKSGTNHKKDLTLQKKLFEFEKELKLQEFIAWMSTFKNQAYRIKGFIATNEGNYNLECVLGEWELHPTQYDNQKSFIVVLYNAKQLKINNIKNEFI